MSLYKEGRIERNIYYHSSSTHCPFKVVTAKNGVIARIGTTSLGAARLLRDGKGHTFKCGLCSKVIYSKGICYSCSNKSKDYAKEHRDGPAIYSTYEPQLRGYVECARSTVNTKHLVVKCYKCDNYFEPSVNQVGQKISAINGKARSKYAQNNLYYSKKCKLSCDTYRKVKFQTGHPINSLNLLVRCNQQTNKKALLSIQVDKFGYKFCDICGITSEQDPELHHGLMVAEHPNEADNIAHQLLCCKECHKKFKNKGGC